MPKRKPPPEKRTWARIVNREWQLNLVGGEILSPLRELSVAEGRQELKLVSGDVRIPERNGLELYRFPDGTEAVVVYHHH